MTLRITSSTNDSVRIVRVEGRLAAEFVAELLAESQTDLPRLRLDLSGLQSADREGLRTLRKLRADGAVLEGASPYILELLDGGS